MATAVAAAVAAVAVNGAAARGIAGTQTRRGLLAWLAWTGWGTIALIALQAAVAFLFYVWPRRMGPFGTRVSAGSPSDYQPGDVRYVAEGRFYLVRLHEGFVALYQKCPHLGCTVPWKPAAERLHEGQLVQGLFVCPCHGSTYLRNGQVIKGPAPRSLDYMPIRLEQGRLVVDTGSIKRREAWDPGQAFPA
jgi:cytochrome b6-f complex iron-sulfur subunit